ncbi:porin [Pseudoduganella namucuonensis]|uniref:Outer membrane protein (Porin) n=1 Tax=Pseudoduganella namucuonensis TaxID=1035707 RepID=A0A1I7EYI5_9BURK|nr:porin [Pseudoduganella namucuonensis]SFU28955.1 Outer membrane protein (porin) [Pseudoduganella namucuonensis]
MKKTLISIAVLGAMSNVALAQTNVTIYGIVDAGLVSERGGKAGNVTKVSSGVGSASRIGFRGTEDLGGGLSAVFVLESGFAADTGVGDAAGLFQRQSYVGLSSKTAGSVTLGRQYTPAYLTLATVADPFAAGLAGSAKNLFGASGGNVRFSNAVNYKSPNVNGFSGEFQYGVGEQAESNAGRQLGLGVGYENKGLNVRVAYNNRNNDTATGLAPVVNRDSARTTIVAANYNFNVVKAFAAYSKDKGPGSSPLPNATAYTATAVAASNDSDTVLVGATAPIGAAGTLIASYIRKDDNEVANRDANQWALGYSHALSKRTSSYVAYAKIKNKRGASYTVGNNSEAGSGDKAFNVGVKHMF